MTKFSEAALGTLIFIGLALIFLGAVVASDTVAPNLMLFGVGGALVGLGVFIGGKIA